MEKAEAVVAVPSQGFADEMRVATFGEEQRSKRRSGLIVLAGGRGWLTLVG